MSLILHQSCSADEALADFGGAAAATWYCDGEFAVLPKAVLCLATVGDAASRSHLETPSTFVWIPRRNDYAPRDKPPWLPAPVREVWSAHRERVKEHHVLLRGARSTRYVYAGSAHLGSWGESSKEGPTACFYLDVKLPRHAWLRMGGYRGWQVEVQHTLHLVDFRHVQHLRSLLRPLNEQEFAHLRMTRYEEDSLSIFTNASRGWLMYLRTPDDSGLYTRDDRVAGDQDAIERFRCACGIDLEFPVNQTLPRDKAIHAVVQFFRKGELPRNLPWEES